MESITGEKIFVLVDISEENFKEQAQIQELKMKLMKQNYQKSFENKDEFINEVEPFYSKYYQIVINHIIKTVLDIELLKQQEIILDIYFTHRPNSVSKISNIWLRRLFSLPAPFSFFLKMIWQGKNIIYNEIDAIQRYFGEKITLFYAFVSFCICHFFVLSLIGLIYSFFYIDNLFIGFDIFPIWGYFCCLWSMLILKLWIRKNREIIHRWGITDISTVREVRDEYRGDELYAGINTNLEKQSISKLNVL
jgi:hypothetical protein